MIEGVSDRLADEALGQHLGLFTLQPFAQGLHFDLRLRLPDLEEDGIGRGVREFALSHAFLGFVFEEVESKKCRRQ